MAASLKVIQPPGPNPDNILFDQPCNVNVEIGDIVRIEAGQVERAQGDNYTNSLVLGICVDKPDTDICNVMISGPTEDTFTGLTAGALYYLSADNPGELTNSIPTGSGNYGIRIGKAYSLTGLVIQIERVVKRM